MRYPNPSVLIYNRWGKLVYVNEDYQNDWTGLHYESGDKLKEGIYYYIIDPESEKYNYNSTLIKWICSFN